MADTKYLMQRHQTWYVKVKVPARLQGVVGATHIIRSLKTRDLGEAQKLRHGAVASIKAELALKDQREPFNVLQMALALRKKLEEAPRHPVKTDPDVLLPSPYDDLHDHVVEEAERLEGTMGPDLSATFFKVATDTSPLLVDARTAWLKETERHLTKHTARLYKAVTERFMTWAATQKAVMVSDITKRLAGRFVTEGFVDYLPSTVNRHITTLSVWWKWMDKKGMTDTNPWTGQHVTSKATRGGAQETRRAYKAEEIVTLLKGLQERPLGALFRLGLFMGARLDELCALRVTDVVVKEDGLWVSITEGKTANAVRVIPVHSAIKGLLETLVIEATAFPNNTEGWLFPMLVPGGPDKRRSFNVSKLFTRKRRKLGVDSSETVFHSTRKNLIEMLEAAEVPLNTAKLLVGHSRGDMTYGRYSKGTLVDLRAAIERVSYPEEVMGSL